MQGFTTKAFFSNLQDFIQPVYSSESDTKSVDLLLKVIYSPIADRGMSPCAIGWCGHSELLLVVVRNKGPVNRL